MQDLLKVWTWTAWTLHNLSMPPRLSFGTQVDFGSIAIIGIRRVLTGDFAQDRALGFWVLLNRGADVLFQGV